MLRNKLRFKTPAYPDPIYGVDLRAAYDDIAPGFARLTQNCYYDGGLRERNGSTRLTTSSLGAFGGRGGYKFYYGTTGKRLIAYSTKISVVSDGGAETVLTSGMTSDLDTYFQGWAIDATCYISNGTDTLRSYDGTTFATVTGTNIPTGFMVTPFVDRLFCIQGSVVVMTNPRVANVWSPTTSTWAAFRPTGGVAKPTALWLHSTTGQQGDPLAQLLVFQASAVSAITGTSFDADVTAATNTTAFDGALTLLDANVGTISPKSITTVPGLGTFWVTQDARVAWLRFGGNPYQVGGSHQAVIVSDRIFSNRSGVNGINNVNFARLDQVRMIYHDRKLKLFFPIIGDTYTTTQYWLDVRVLLEHPDYGYVWNGPMLGQSLRDVWVENQSGDTDTLYATEGNSVTGLFVYTLNVANTWTDAVGTADNDVVYTNHTLFHGFGAEGRQKLITELQMGVRGSVQNATVTLRDLHGGAVATGLLIKDVDGTTFTSSKYGTSFKYGTTNKYGGGTIDPRMGRVNLWEQDVIPLYSDRISVETTHTVGNFAIDSISADVQIRRQQPVR